jgi:hypothetical protein
MERTYKIYSLSNPITKEIRYVGVTVSRLSQRLSQHKCAAFTKNVKTHVCNWIKTLKKQNLYPIITLIEECDKNNWEEKEKYWINNYNNLTNIREGGKGLIVDRTKDSLQRSSDGHKKKVVVLSLNYDYINTFSSIGECAKNLNVKITSISNVLSKKMTNITAGNHIILYEKDYLSNNYNKSYINKSKIVYMYDCNKNLLQVFSSVTEAFNIINPCKYPSGIFEAIKRKGKCGGYYWSDKKF